MSGTVHLSRPGGIALLTLHNPGKRNALDLPLLRSLAQVLKELAGEGTRAAVLTGAPDEDDETGCDVFSAGYDISALPDEPEDDWLREHGPLGEAIAALSLLPVVAAVGGPAIGSGCELALSCDLRVLHPGSSFQMPPVRMGLIYTPSGLQRLGALCGAGRAREMLLTARQVPAEEALSFGLCNQVVPREELLSTALALAGEIARGAPLAVRGTRYVLDRLLSEGPGLSPQTAQRVLALRREAWRSEDAREARRAFQERRAPRFQGK